MEDLTLKCSVSPADRMEVREGFDAGGDLLMRICYSEDTAGRWRSHYLDRDTARTLRDHLSAVLGDTSPAPAPAPALGTVTIPVTLDTAPVLAQIEALKEALR